MQAEETVRDGIIGGSCWVAGFEHGGHPRVTDTAIKATAHVVDHPVDGLARLAPSQFVALRSAVHLVLGEAEGGQHFVAEIRVIGTALFHNVLPR